MLSDFETSVIVSLKELAKFYKSDKKLREYHRSVGVDEFVRFNLKHDYANYYTMEGEPYYDIL